MLPERLDFITQINDQNLAFQANQLVCVLRRSLTCGYENLAFQAKGKNATEESQ
ncbi:MAG: hypothetical protein LBC02_04475 [Planctomycetaceae bacterium]|jgi:hypothetical protein|nr:hypothetical protein [Planctomycetaceae bacterium]